MNKRWIIKDVDIDSNISDIDSVMLEVLSKRGLKEKKEILNFLQGDLDDLHDPFLFNDMKKTITRIKRAIDNRERIIVYGDYDVDGITSTSLLYNYFLDNYNFKVDYYIPERIKEGYGLNIEAVKKIVDDYDLLITVDCGITACQEVEFARKAGLDVIITDHHQAEEILPDAYAILNPHLQDDNYPCKYLAGVGVAFKVCQALGKKWSNHLDLVALGTIADIVPLKDENHILVKQGLKAIKNSDNCGLKKLLEKLNLTDKPLTAGKVGYILAPPLNAAGRIEDPQKAMKLLTDDTKESAESIAQELTNINKSRQQQEEEIFQQALEMVEKKVDFSRDKSIVLASEDWHPGIIGIVASRLVERYYVPVVLIALTDEKGRGSCRSIKGVNIHKVLQICSDLLIDYGGHAQAAGLTVAENKIANLRKKINNYLDENFTERDFIPQIEIDTVLEEKDINRKLYEKLSKLMPFGIGNPRPKFLITNTSFKKCYTVGKKDKHLKFELENGISGIGFNFGHFKNNLFKSKVDIAFNIKLNRWQGKEELQLNLVDINLRESSKIYPVTYKSKNLRIYDKRDCSDIDSYIDRLSNSDICTGVYINNKKKFRVFRDKFDDGNIHFFTNTDSLASIKLKELVLVSLPFSRVQLYKMLDLLQSKDLKLHLLYGHQEYYTGCKLIKSQLPTDNFLKNLYKSIKNNEYRDFVANYNKKRVDKGLNILADLELIESSEKKIELLAQPQNKLDFSKSIRYNEITDIIDKFNDFAQLAYAKNLFKLIEIVKKYYAGGK